MGGGLYILYSLISKFLNSEAYVVTDKVYIYGILIYINNSKIKGSKNNLGSSRILTS